MTPVTALVVPTHLSHRWGIFRYFVNCAGVAAVLLAPALFLSALAMDAWLVVVAMSYEIEEH